MTANIAVFAEKAALTGHFVYRELVPHNALPPVWSVMTNALIHKAIPSTVAGVTFLAEVGSFAIKARVSAPPIQRIAQGNVTTHRSIRKTVALAAIPAQADKSAMPAFVQHPAPLPKPFAPMNARTSIPAQAIAEAAEMPATTTNNASTALVDARQALACVAVSAWIYKKATSIAELVTTFAKTTQPAFKVPVKSFAKRTKRFAQAVVLGF